MSHGQDDFVGGLVKVSKVLLGISAGKPTPFVEIKERPGTQYNWLILAEEQEKLKAQFGDKRAYADPDDREEFNRWD